jgi:hypothetical protein
VSFDTLFPEDLFTKELTDVHPIVPVVGMLCGNAIAGVLVSLSFVLKELE